MVERKNTSTFIYTMAVICDTFCGSKTNKQQQQQKGLVFKLSLVSSFT